MERGGGAGARRVFPLGLGQQAVVGAGLRGQPGDVSLRVVPAHVDHRARAAAPAAVVGAVPAAAAAGYAGVPFCEGDLVDAHRKRGCDGYTALLLVGMAAGFRGR